MTPAVASLTALRREFAARGWYRKPTGRIVFELLVHLMLAVGGILVFLGSDNLLIRACGMVISTAGSIGVGTNTHTSSHYATSNKRWLNELLTYFGCPFFLGLSASYWWRQHVVVHHPAPNVVGVDDDMDLAPWFARTHEEVKRSRGLRRYYYEKVQWVVFPMALAANGFHMQRAGWLHVIRMLRDPARRKKAHWIDLGALLLHYVTMLVIPMCWFAPGNVVAFYLLRFGLMGYAMFVVLAPGHFPVEAACLSKEQKDSDYLLLQTAATVNFRTGVLGRLICSGLEYQIEHHLFPNVSHVYYQKMSMPVEKFCREHGLPYRSYQWDYVLWKCLTVFRTPSPIESSLEALRVPNQAGVASEMALGSCTWRSGGSAEEQRRQTRIRHVGLGG
jgi:fatty acid desaturase